MSHNWLSLCWYWTPHIDIVIFKDTRSQNDYCRIRSVFIFIRDILNTKVWRSKVYMSFMFFWKNIFSHLFNVLKYLLTFKALFGKTGRNMIFRCYNIITFLKVDYRYEKLPQTAKKKWMDVTFHSILTSKPTKIQVTLTTSNYFKRLLLSISGKTIPLTSCLSVPVHVFIDCFWIYSSMI